MREEIKELLDNYYGDQRSDDQKYEIVYFIEDYSSELLDILRCDPSNNHS